MRRKSMTNTEKQIFRLISDNPMITQDELAFQANISRSSASVHISNLVKKGYIAGRGYVISQYENVVLVGSAMVDLYGKSGRPLLKNESNPGTVTMHVGGVSRNIAENLSRLGIKVSLISSICSDPFGQLLKENCKKVGIDISHSFFPQDMNQTVYLAVLDDDGEMDLAISDTTALQQLPLEHLEKKESVIDNGEVVIMDTSLSKKVLEYMVKKHKNKKLVIDPVSIGMSRKMKHIIGKFHTIKCNKNEAEFLSDMVIHDHESLVACANKFLEKGVEQIFITLGKEGVYYSDGTTSGIVDTLEVDVANVTGAGDAFTAGVAYCLMSNSTIEFSAKFSTCMSALALTSIHAVSDEISLHKINELMKQKWKGKR